MLYLAKMFIVVCCLLLTSAISCLLRSGHQCASTRELECAFTSPVRTECGMFVMCCAVCSALCLCKLFEVRGYVSPYKYKCL